MKAHLRRALISPRKAVLVAGLVRRKQAEEALSILKFANKKGAAILYKALHSAVANAETNFGADRKKLVIKQILVGKGPIYRRHVPTGRGRALPIAKATSHITVELHNLDVK